MARYLNQAREKATFLLTTGPLILLASYMGILNIFLSARRHFTTDWGSIWGAGLLVARGQADHLYDFDPIDFAKISGSEWFSVADAIPQFGTHPYVHIPIFAWLVSFLPDIMEYETSMVVLTFLSGFCTVVIVAAAYKLWFRSTIPASTAMIASHLLLISAPMLAATALWQTTPIIFAVVLSSCVCSKKMWLPAGILLGFVSILKITPLAVVAVLFLFKDKRLLSITAALTSAIGLVASYYILGASVFWQWIHTLRRISKIVPVDEVNQSLQSILLVPQYNDPDILAPTVVVPRNLAIISAAITLSLALAMLFAMFKSRKWRYEITVTFAFVIPIVSASIMWTHYLSFAIVLVFGIWATAPQSQWRYLFYTLTAVASVLLYPPLCYSVLFPESDYNILFAGYCAVMSLLVIWLISLAVNIPWARTQRIAVSASDSEQEANLGQQRPSN